MTGKIPIAELPKDLQDKIKGQAKVSREQVVELTEKVMGVLGSSGESLEVQRRALELARRWLGRYVKWRIRKAVLERDKACVYCGLPVAIVVDNTVGGANDQWRAYDIYSRPFHFDHKIPFSQGGKSDETNIVLACADCNLRKAKSEHPRAKVDLKAREAGFRGDE